MATTIIEQKDLLQAIQNLPEDKMAVVWGFIQTLQDEDDEPLTEEDLKALDATDKEIADGHFYTLDEFNRRMAALP